MYALLYRNDCYILYVLVFLFHGSGLARAYTVISKVDRVGVRSPLGFLFILIFDCEIDSILRDEIYL